MADHRNGGRLEKDNVSPNKEEIMCEIGNGLKHIYKAILKALATLKIGYDARKPSPFDLLPDEMLMKIIKMTMNGHGEHKHSELATNIANISRRFKNLATDKSLWKGRIYINVCRDKSVMKELIHKFLGSEVEEVEFRAEFKLTRRIGHTLTLPNEYISAKDIATLLENCHNLRSLKLEIGETTWNSTSTYTRHDLMKLLLNCPGWGLVP